MTAKEAAKAGLPAIGFVKSRMFCKNTCFRFVIFCIILYLIGKEASTYKTIENAK